MGDTEGDGDKSSPDEHYTLHRPKEILHKCKSDPGYNIITGTEITTSTDDLVTENVRSSGDQSSITCDSAGVDKVNSPTNEQTNISYNSKTINCTSSRLISPGNISCTSRHSVGNVADTINCSSSGDGDDDTIGYDGDENIPQNAMYSRGSFSTRSLRYPSSLGTNSGGISSGYNLTGGTTTRKCVLTLDGYSYVIVASTPENRINNRDDSVTASHVLERRGYEKSKSNSPTSSQSSCPLNGQVAKQGGLTIVRRSNSRKGNLTYQGATTPTTDQQSSYEQHLLPSSSGAIINLDDQQQQLLETSFITSGGGDTIPSATIQTSTITNTFRTIDQLTSEQYSLLSSNNTINTTTIATTNMQTATIKSNTSTTTTPTGDNNAVTIGGSNINNAVTGYSTPASYGDIDIETIDLATETLPAVDTPDACDKAAVRLRCLLRLLQRGEISAEVLQKNLHYAARVLEAVFIDETKSPRSRINSTISFNNDNNCTNKQGQINEKTENERLADEDDELSEVQPDAVPPEVREWLASTFTRQLATARKRTDEKPKFRSVAHAIRAGIFVDRIYRRVSSSALMQFPPEVVKVLKTLDDWSFDVFALAEAANGQPVKYLGYDLLNRYGMIHKFKIPPATLEIFLNRIEEGYCRFHNPYHNNLHAADVTQTTHHILCQTGLMNWLSDLEIFATLLAALIHDFEHTGTTNNFHVMSGSETAMLYNDRAVLENHHISAAFRVLKEDDANVLANLSREEYRELRTLVIDMVLSTDMSYHFQQLKNMKNLLTIDSPTVDKSKALSLVLHCCDISHPAKKWSLHHRWTMLLLEEFFRQGDLERELGLPFSPLCDRNNTLVAESQIGFIDFIVDPSMTVCSDMLEYILAPITPIGSSNTANTNKNNDENVTTDASGGGVKKTNSITNKVTCEPITEGVELAKNGSTTDSDGKQKFRIRKPWNTTLAENKKIWKEQAVRDAEARAATAALTEAEENKDGNQQEVENTKEDNDDTTTTTTTTAEKQD